MSYDNSMHVTSVSPGSRGQLIKTRDVAARLGMSARQVRNLVDAGKLRAIRIDHHLRFDHAEIVRLIQASAVQAHGVRIELEPPATKRRSGSDPDKLSPLTW